MNKEEKIPGEVLRNLNKDIKHLEELLMHFEPGTKHGIRGTMAGSLPTGDIATDLWHKFREQTINQLRLLQDARGRHLFSPATTPPSAAKLVCPHCGYDGEFDKEDPDSIDGIGFRVLQPVLEPRFVESYKEGVLTLTDSADSYDPFYMISDPGHVDCIDNREDNPLEKDLRRMLRGRWIFVCGNVECLSYFDASEFARKAEISYPGISPHNDRFKGKR